MVTLPVNDTATEVRGCCPLDCQDSCAWIATVEDGVVTGVAGDRDHPITRGVLCAKVRDFETRVYAKDRLLHPLRRAGPKGSATFERISWDEALDTITDRWRSIIQAHGPEALMPLHYLGSLGVIQRRALMRVFHALGASRIHGEVCGRAAQSITELGHPFGFDPEEITESRLIVLWGANILTTAHHHWRFIQEARQKHGAEVISIDPRRTRTARQSDIHLPIRPGTDVVLAAAVGRLLLKEGLYDAAYVAAVVTDLDAYRAEVAPWTPERAAGVCGLDPNDIVLLARKLGAARPAVIRSGVGPQQTASGDAYARALSALVLLGGHWAHKGGGLFAESSPDFDDVRAERADIAPGPRRSLDISRLGQILTDDTLVQPVKALTVWGMNPAVIQPDLERVWQGLAREDLFTVVIDHFVNDTAAFADIVLPSTTQLEHFDIQGAWGHHYISLNNPAVRPLGETKGHGEIMRLLAARMGLQDACLQESDEQIAASALPATVSLADLREKGWIKTLVPRPDPRERGQQLSISIGLTESSVADWFAPPQDEPDALRLLTPKAHHFLNSSFANMPRHRASQRLPRLRINPADAQARGLRANDQVAIRSGDLSLTAGLEITDEVRPGVVTMEGKWWRRTDGPGAVVNRLAPARWTPSGQPTYNDIFVTVSAQREAPATEAAE